LVWGGLCAAPALAQAANPCDVLARSIISEERSYTIETIRKSNLTYLCEASITSREEAIKQGWKVGFVIEGVPIEAIWSSDQKTRDEARKALCSTVDAQTDRLTIQETVSRVPRKSIAAIYAQCVAVQAATGGQVAAYFMPPADGTNLTYQIYYAKDLNIPDPRITRAEVTGASTKVLKDSDGSPFVGKKLTPGVRTFPVVRDGNQEVRVILETDQGQKIPPVTAPVVPLDLAVRFDVYGQKKMNEGYVVYQLEDERNCGDDTLSYTRPWTLGQLERFPVNFAWSKSTSMGNCDARSDVDAVQRNGESHATIQYHMVGCGYSAVFKACKGRGILRSTVTAPIEYLDPNTSRIWSEEKEGELEFVTGASPFYLVKTVQELGRVTDIEWTVTVDYPAVTKQKTLVKRKLVLTKNQPQSMDQEASLCFRAKTSTNGQLLVEVTDYRDAHCDDPAYNYSDFLRKNDPCRRADNGLPLPVDGLPATDAPVDCVSSGK